MTDNQQSNSEQPRVPDRPENDRSRSTIEERTGSREPEAYNEYYDGMLGPEDSVDRNPNRDQWALRSRETESDAPDRLGGDDEVGHGKPPKKHQFRPGQSGNPYGRPRKKRGPLLPASLNEAIVIELARKQSVTVGGKIKRMSTEKLIAKRIVTGLATCDPKMLPMWLNALLRSGFPQAVEELREREEARSCHENAEMIAAWEDTIRTMDELFADDPEADVADARALSERELARAKKRGARRPRN